MGLNLSDTTPAASSGHTNVTWQKDSSGNASAQIPTPVDAATQAANKVLAGPTTGSAATPAFRLLVAADVPNIAESQVTSLTADLAAKTPTARTVSTTAPLTGGGDLSADRTLAISNFTGDSGSGGAKGAVPAPASGDASAGKFLKADGTWATPSGGMSNPMTTQGDIIYGGASGTPTRLAGGTSSYVLTSNGATSAPSWQAAAGGGGAQFPGQSSVTTPPTTGWTAVSPAGNTVPTLDTSNPGYILLSYATANDWGYATRSLSGTPYTITIHAYSVAVGSSNGVAFGWADNANAARFITVGGNGVSSIQSENSNGTFNNGSALTYGGGSIGLWFRFSDDGTTRKVEWSGDGRQWMEILSETRTTFITPTKFMLGVYNSKITIDSLQ